MEIRKIIGYFQVDKKDLLEFSKSIIEEHNCIVFVIKKENDKLTVIAYE